MITLSILKQLQIEGFGTIDTDLFLEEVPISTDNKPKEGLWIVTRGSAVSRFNVEIQSFDIYSRFTSKLEGHTRLAELLQWMQEAYSDVCTLPAVPPYTTSSYENVRITPTSGVENVGTDENGKVVRVISGEVYYQTSP
jgi:hypothetical protein